MKHLWIRLPATALLAAGLSGCGGGKSSVPTVSVTCNGQMALAGAQSVDVSGTAGGGATLSFPDPVNAGRTGTIPVPAGTSCSVAPTRNIPG